MIKKITMFCFALLLVGALAHAATEPKTMSKSMSTKATRVEGTIQSIDNAKHSITVQTGADTHVYQLGSNTEYLENGKKTKTVDLKQGEKVSVEADSRNMARVVEIQQ